MTTGSNVFYDLEIFPEHVEFLEDEDKLRSFEAAVKIKVDELESILEEKAQPTSKIEERARLDLKQNPEHKKNLKENTGEIMTFLTELGETRPFAEVLGMVDELRKLAHDLELAVHDRAKRESLTMTESIGDKKMAQVQHKRLRDAWTPIRAIAKMMYGIELFIIKARPGNYAASETKAYAFQFPGEEDIYYNFRYVARRLGIFVEGKTFYKDVVDYASDNPELVEVKEVIL